jgi:hypothetical protein
LNDLDGVSGDRSKLSLRQEASGQPLTRRNHFKAQSELVKSTVITASRLGNPREGVMPQTELTSAQMRRRFRLALWAELKILWPIVSALLLIQFILGIIAGYIEQWSLGESIYFTSITGLTIGYGDFAPKHFISRVGAVIIGMVGVVLMGLIAAIAVRALDAPGTDRRS